MAGNRMQSTNDEKEKKEKPKDTFEITIVIAISLTKVCPAVDANLHPKGVRGHCLFRALTAATVT